MSQEELEQEVVRLQARLTQQTDWYQQRFNALRAWVNNEVRPLSAEAAHRYFAICANGSPVPHEQADWRDTLHGLTLRAEQAERHRDVLREFVEDEAERDCAYGDNCPSNAGTRHGTCTACKARRALLAAKIHVWTYHGDLECCLHCGVVRRADGQNNPCKGIARIEVR